MSTLNPAQLAYLRTQRLARLATTGADGRPHVVPVNFRHNPETGTIDSGGYQVDTTKRWRDVRANPWAAIVIDDLASIDPWSPRMIEIRGRAETVEAGGTAFGKGFGDAVIRIHPDRISSFGIE